MNQQSSKMVFRARALVADDHVIFTDALRLMLEQKYQVVGAVSDGRAMVSAALQMKPDFIIVDVGMPLLNGLDAARQVRESLPDVKLVFITMQADPNLAAAALELGHAAFVLKQSAGSELLKAIEEVLHERTYMTPRLKADDWATAKMRARRFSKALTPRQREIVQMFAEGRTTKEVAGHLNLSVKTVDFHKYHIMHTCNLKSTADLVLFAQKLGLVPAPDVTSPNR